MTLVPNETERALNRQYDVYAAAREEYRKKIAEQAAHIERLEAEAKSRTLDYLGQVGQLSEELEREKREAERAQDAHGVRFLNYLEETARLTDRIEQLEEEVKVWVNHTKTAVWSDSEECKMLTRINEALIAAPTVDVDVVVPDRDYSTMTPRDCYEAGLLDGVYQAREAIKAAARAALEDRT